MKKILIIQGHPFNDTFTNDLKASYRRSAEKAGAEVKEIKLNQLDFQLNLKAGYKEMGEMEPDLKNAQEQIQWADHLVFLYPNWWSTYPALLKGFIDRVFTPGFAFKFHKGFRKWEKLLKGKTARLIVTMDQPAWYYRFVMKQPGHHAMKRGVLEFCGIEPVRISTIGPIKNASEKKRRRWLIKMEKHGADMN